MALTVRTKSGQTASIEQDGAGIVIEKRFVKEIKGSQWVAEADSKFWEKKGINVPSALKGKKLAITIVEQDAMNAQQREQWEKESKEKEDAIKKAMDAKIIGFVYEIGCDWADRVTFKYEDAEKLEWTIEQKRTESHERLAKAVAKLVSNELPKNIEANLSTYGGWLLKEEVSGYIERAKEIIESENTEREAKSQTKKAEYESLKAEKLAEAKRTGQMVYIRDIGGYDGDERYPGKEFGWVNIVEMATPDGRIITNDSPSY